MHAVHNKWQSEGKNSFAQGSVSHRFSTRDIWMPAIMYFNDHHIGIKQFSAVLNFCTLLKWDGVGINKINQFASVILKDECGCILWKTYLS